MLLGLLRFGSMAEKETREVFGVIHRNPKLALSIFDSSFEHRNYLELPFRFGDGRCSVDGGSCGGWLYFNNAEGEIVIWNRLSDVYEFLPQPILDKGQLMATGMGYVSESGDYKFIRYYHHYRFTTYPGGPPRMLDGVSRHFEVCSFRPPAVISSWREILGNDTTVSSINAGGVYLNVTGRCYWVASYTNLSPREIELRVKVANAWASPYAQFDQVVSFDFATERFHQFRLPATTLGPAAKYQLVGYRGSLGALVYVEPGLYSSSSDDDESTIQLHEWSLKNRSWKLKHVVVSHVARPLQALKDSRFLFLESKPSGGRSHLLVYDLKTKTEKQLDISDEPACIRKGVSFDLSMDPPLARQRKSSRKGKKRKSSRKGKGTLFPETCSVSDCIEQAAREIILINVA